MSEENKKTLKVYKERAGIYLRNNIIYEIANAEEYELRRKFIENLIRKDFENISINGNVFEVGSGDGKNANYIKSLGYNITASDTVDIFINNLIELGLKTIKFDLLEDEFPNKYDAILCWRVFIHFTFEDLATALYKIYNSLENNGMLLFNLFNINNSNINGKWIDFDGIHNIGSERYYSYFSKEEIDELIKKIGYKLFDFCYECPNEKYLVYSLIKKN